MEKLDASPDIWVTAACFLHFVRFRSGFWYSPGIVIFVLTIATVFRAMS